MTKTLNITSTAAEMAIDGARSFLSKLISPAVEEAGLLLKDHVTHWRLKNQIKILEKTQRLCEQHGISPKKVSLKLLCPLLEQSSLEEDEFLQDKWAALLANLVDSEQNIENHVFPHILSQISKGEFIELDKVYNSKKNRVLSLKQDLKQLKIDYPTLKEELLAKMQDVELRKKTRNGTTSYWDILEEERKLRDKLSSLESEERYIGYRIKESETVPSDILKEFEIANLVRLGLIREIHEVYADTKTVEIPNDRDEDFLTVDIDIEVESDKEYILTELGELFILACSEKETN